MIPLVEKAKKAHSDLKIETLAWDKGYDSKEEIEKLWDNHSIKPVIDIRDMWKDGKETRALRDDIKGS